MKSVALSDLVYADALAVITKRKTLYMSHLTVGILDFLIQ